MRHRWDLTPKEAVALQRRLRSRVVRRNDFGSIRTLAGVDASFRGGRARAAVVLLSWPGLQTIETRVVTRALRFPYVPGLLSFREMPSVLAALRALKRKPDLVMCDGQGIAHPRRFGLASHLGVYLDRPALGCAKSLLCGRHGTIGRRRGSRADLFEGGERIGAAVRTRTGVKPVFVSIGHRISLARAVMIVLECARTRIPEPTRLADRLSKVDRPARTGLR